MSFQDKQLTCADCGAPFTFTAEEQEFYASKGFTNEPKRCQPCRQSRKNDRSGSGSRSYGGGSREMHKAVCAECGKDTEVPFQPRGDKPVYCSDCYRKIKPAR